MGDDLRALSGSPCNVRLTRREAMKLYILPPSPRAFKVIALKNHLGIECEMHIIDLGKGDQLTPEYIAMNPNKKMPFLKTMASSCGNQTRSFSIWPQKGQGVGFGPLRQKARPTCCGGSRGRVRTGTPNRAVWWDTRESPKPCSVLVRPSRHSSSEARRTSRGSRRF